MACYRQKVWNSLSFFSPLFLTSKECWKGKVPTGFEMFIRPCTSIFAKKICTSVICGAALLNPGRHAGSCRWASGAYCWLPASRRDVNPNKLDVTSAVRVFGKPVTSSTVIRHVRGHPPTLLRHGSQNGSVYAIARQRGLGSDIVHVHVRFGISRSSLLRPTISTTATKIQAPALRRRPKIEMQVLLFISLVLQYSYSR